MARGYVPRTSGKPRTSYRDPVHGFVLLAHTEIEGRYRPPHDHGRSWVIYGVLQGEMKMGTYAPRQMTQAMARGWSSEDRRSSAQETYKVYLPGDIHDTLCVSGPAIQFRFTARDLRQETTMVRYADAGGRWVPTT